MSLNCALKMVKAANFVTYILCSKKKRMSKGSVKCAYHLTK